MPRTAASRLPADAFGDPFDIARLPLPRPADGYAVQMLDTDRLLDRDSGEFLPVRNPRLKALHESFAAAFAAAEHWQFRNEGQGLAGALLAIVPVAYDHDMQRHILIYGVLPPTPAPKREYRRD